MAVEDFKVYTQDSGWVSLAQTLPQGTSEGQLLHWDGTQWSAASDGTADGQYLIWNDAAKRWEPGTHETGNLPIQSDDGTVVLDSPSANTFTVSTGGTERVKVDGVGKVEIGTGSTSTASEFTVNGVSNARFRRNARSADLVDFQDGDCQELRIVNNANGGKDSGVSMSHWSWAVGNTIDQRTQRNQIRFWDEAVSFQTGDGTTNVEVTNDGDLIVRNQVRTSTVKGPADTDASIVLRTTASIWADYSTPLSVNSYKNQSRISFVNSVSNEWDIGSNENLFTIKDATAVRLTISDTDIQANEFHTPTQPNSIATKKTVDDKIQVMTTAEYNALGANVNPTTLYCLTD